MTVGADRSDTARDDPAVFPPAAGLRLDPATQVLDGGRLLLGGVRDGP